MIDSQGWIQLYRNLLNWEWFTDVNTSHLFVYCILKANHKTKKWRGMEIERGQFLTSLPTIAKETGLTVRQIRTSLNKLNMTGELTGKTTNKNRLITITNYDRYQVDDRQDVNQMTGKRQASDRQTTATNNDNNDNNDNNIIIRDFEKFWIAYPVNGRNKGSKKEAMTKFKVALGKDSFDNIMEGAKNYENYIRNTGQSNRDAFRWLEKEQWRDDYAIQSYDKPAGAGKKSKHQRAKEALGLA